jgi:hypothetical protein
MKKISLSQNQFTTVDDEDFDFLNQWQWFATWNVCTKSFYAGRNIKINKKKTTIGMSRVLMNPTKEKEIDHINHDTLDNRKINLRIVDKKQNAFNRKTYSTNKLGFKGVYSMNPNVWKTKPFVASIQVEGKRIHLGYYKTAKEAAIAYNQAAKKHHGQFALLNQVLPL